MDWLTQNPLLVLILTIMGIIELGILVFGFILWIKGIFPVVYRLGKSLSTGKIAIFSNNNFSMLSDLLVDSKIFNVRNIKKIHEKDLHKAKSKNIFLVDWNEFGHLIQDILDIKNDETALIVYAPDGVKSIDPETFKKINSRRNSIVVNMPGRLLNDILISCITSNYGK